MSEHTIHLIGGGDDEAATVTTERLNGLCRVVLRYRGREIEANAQDYFEAFCRVREHLEAKSLIPFCYGASLHVFPSGMCRDMGAGMKAYKLTRGRKPQMADLVRIFDEGPDVIPATVARQREFYDDWLKS